MSEKDTDVTGEPSDRQMTAKIDLLVSDSNDSTFGEIIVLDEIRKAESTIEALLEVGFEQERVRVFSGAEINIQVTYRPVVVLASDLEASADESRTPPRRPGVPRSRRGWSRRVATGPSRKSKRQRPPSERGAHLVYSLLEASEAA